MVQLYHTLDITLYNLIETPRDKGCTSSFSINKLLLLTNITLSTNYGNNCNPVFILLECDECHVFLLVNYVVR